MVVAAMRRERELKARFVRGTCRLAAFDDCRPNELSTKLTKVFGCVR